MARTSRPDAEKPVSVSVRIPRALYDEVQARALMRRTTLTALMVEGLRLCLDMSVDPREVPVSQSITALQELEQMIDARVHAVLDAIGLLALAPVITSLVEPGEDPVPELLHDGNAVIQQAPSDACPPFDRARFYLGRLCPQRHAWGTTGQSLLRKHNQRCRQCENETKRRRRGEKHGALSLDIASA